MATCPRCGERVDRPHLVSLQVVTKESVSAAGGTDRAADPEEGARCVRMFVDGDLVP